VYKFHGDNSCDLALNNFSILQYAILPDYA